MSVISPNSSPWIRKPISVVARQESIKSQRSAQASPHPNRDQQQHPHLYRHLSVGDLVLIGVGGTVGSGIFVLTGEIARNYAGPATFVSFAIAGVATIFSGVCYAELSARIPAAGSSYVYAYVCLGEVAAVMAASCLTLEYGIAGAAVARSWGDKVVEWLSHFGVDGQWLQPQGFINIPGFLVSAGSTLLLLAGVQESKRVTNFMTSFKMLIVVFMAIGGLCLFKPSNMKPFAPNGLDGVLRGATSSFFGYLGYDEVCTVAGEAKHPARDMPRAVMGTIAITCVSYVTAALALTGMVYYTNISVTSGFPDAFHQRQVEWAASITAFGELVTLPVVVLVSYMAQPRVTLSMADDGLMPAIFKRLDNKGNLWGGTLCSGVAMTMIATFVPFTYLNDLISAGILFSFSITNSCLILLRCESSGWTLQYLLGAYNGLCFLTAILLSHDISFLPWQPLLSGIMLMVLIGWVLFIAKECPPSWSFGGSILSRHETHYTLEGNVENIPDEEYFRTPFVPYLPCLGMFVNWYLIAQLEALGIFLLVLYLGTVVIIYGQKCAPNSEGHLNNWTRMEVPYDAVQEEPEEDLVSGVLHGLERSRVPASLERTYSS